VLAADAGGHFTLPAVTSGGFSLNVKKSGYKDGRVSIDELPRDQHPDVGLVPLPAQIRLDVRGHDVCLEHPFDPYFSGFRQFAAIPVRNSGVIVDLCGISERCLSPFSIGVEFFFYRIGSDGRPIRVDRPWYPPHKGSELKSLAGTRTILSASAM